MSNSIYEQILGDAYLQLHPLLQRKFGIHSSDNQAVFGEGTMAYIRGGAFWYRPFFRFFSAEHLMFSERGENVPFTIENHAFRDGREQEKVSWIRRFHFPKRTRAFDAVMYIDKKTGQLYDAFGRHGRLVVPLTLQVTKEGGLHILAKHAFFRKQNGSLIPIPQLFVPRANVYEHVVENDKIHIEVHIYNTILGTIICYKGLVNTTFKPSPSNILHSRRFDNTDRLLN